MQRKFLTNLALLLFLNVLVKPFYIFGIDVGVQNAVGSEEYGLFFIVLNFSFLFNILLDLGITQFNNRNIARDNQLLNKHFSTILIVKLLLGIIYFLITFSGALIMGYGAMELYFLLFLAMNQFLLMLIQYLRSNISGLFLFKTDSFLSVIDRVLMILICGLLLWGGVAGQSFKIEWFIYAQTFSYFITALISLIIVIKKSAFKKLNWDWFFIITIIRQLYPFSILVFLMTIISRVDTVIISVLLPEGTGDNQAGIYAHAYRLLDAFANYAFLFSVLLLPIFARMIKQKDSIEHLCKLAFSILFIASVIISVNTFFFSTDIINLLYEEQLAESSSMLQLIMFAFVPISITYVFGSLLTANGSLRKLNLVYLVSVGISIILNLILIPRYLALGSAVANLSAQAFAAAAQVYLVVKIFRFKLNFKYVASLLLFVIFVVLLNLLFDVAGFNRIFNFLTISLLSFALALLLRIINLPEIFRTLKQKSLP